MAKASPQRAAQAKVKAAPPPVAADKKAKEAVAATNKKNVGKKAPVKAAAPEMTSTQQKVEVAKTPVSKKAATISKAPPPTKAATQKAAAPKSAAPKAATRAKAVAKAASPKKASPKAAASKTTMKTDAVKKAAPRRSAVRTAVPTPAARRGRPASAPRKAPAATMPAAARKLSGGATQAFTVSHLNEADFQADGLRTYAQYRDLGIAAATGGLCQAHVIRMVPPCTDEVRQRHLHQAELQLVYVLKGWMKNEFEGHGVQMMSAGSCWLQPSGIKHTVLDYSADCEVLEIIVPADFKTEELT